MVEAIALGIDSFGSDISEFNCLLSRVKTASYDLDLLEREIEDILARSFTAPQLRLMEEKATYSASTYLKEWFAAETLHELSSFGSLIDQYTYSDVLRIILSRSARSARMTTHFDLDFPKSPIKAPYYCYKHSRTCQPTRSAKQFLTRYSHDTLKRIKEFAGIREPAVAEIVCGDSRGIEFPVCDLVITSPPYVCLIDYHEQHRYAYELLNLPWKEEKE